MADQTEQDIVVDRASKTFDGQTAVSDATFSVGRGEIFGFVGPSGSGKTTTIRMLTGVYTPTAGHVEVLGQEPSRFSRKNRESIGYLPQQMVMYPNLSALENIRFVASMYGLTPILRRKRIHEALTFVDLWDSRDKLVSELSGGMRRRLQLAAALAHSPRLIFADEPTAGIDPVLRERLWDGFNELRGQGRTLFITTQYVTEAEYCDHVALMADGRVIANDTPEALRQLAVGGEAIDVRASGLTPEIVGLLERLEGVRQVEAQGFESLRVYVEDAATLLPVLVNTLQERGATVSHVEEYRPTFDEVFVRLLEQNRHLPDLEAAQTRERLSQD